MGSPQATKYRAKRHRINITTKIISPNVLKGVGEAWPEMLHFKTTTTMALTATYLLTEKKTTVSLRCVSSPNYTFLLTDSVSSAIFVVINDHFASPLPLTPMNRIEVKSAGHSVCGI